MKISIVGAGPAGLYFARLMKRNRPNDDIEVIEQNPEGATWGFGVALGGRSMKEIESTDAEVHRALCAHMVFNNRQRIHLDGEELELQYEEVTGAIERLTLLRMLIAAARQVGVVVTHGVRVGSIADLANSDVIVAADGVNSQIRREREQAFGTQISFLGNHFAWFGVGAALIPSALVFRSIQAGRFIAHYYAYTAEMSTFVAECDDSTWRAGGFEEMDERERRVEVEAIFAPELAGLPLIENRSLWRQFPVIDNTSWSDDKVVLIGDALRSAHFSIGSGTRLAMEDAAALALAFRETNGDVPKAFAHYVSIRKARRDVFGEAASRSFNWYEEIAQKMRQPLDAFIFAFLTRTGRVDEKRLAQYVPAFYARWSERKNAQAQPK